MREDVCIILNEREPTKKLLAVSLEEQLQLRKISCDRLEPSPTLEKILLERLPRVVVIDYVLGDVATALDILSALSDPISEQQTSAILWTDEPSVNVAVMAMKLGASDYIQSGIAASLEKVTQAVEKALSLNSAGARRQKQTRSSANEQKLVSNSRSYQQCVQLALSAVNSGAQIVVLKGGKGCGRNTLARHLHQERVGATLMFEVDLDIYSGSIADLCGSPDKQYLAPLLSLGNTVFIDHAEFDDGELIESVSKMLAAAPIKSASTSRSLLTIGTSDDKTASAWQRLLSCPCIDIPELGDRVDDLWPLTQAFIGEIKSHGVLNKLAFSPQVIHLLSGHSWPGNVRQLRAAIVEAATIPNPESREKSGKSDHKDLSKADALTLQTILDAKERWESEQASTPQPLSPLETRKILDEVGGNLRVAAAKLHTGIPQIRIALGGAASKERDKYNGANH